MRWPRPRAPDAGSGGPAETTVAIDSEGRKFNRFFRAERFQSVVTSSIDVNVKISGALHPEIRTSAQSDHSQRSLVEVEHRLFLLALVGILLAQPHDGPHGLRVET